MAAIVIACTLEHTAYVDTFSRVVRVVVRAFVSQENLFKYVS